jgi:transposase
LDETSISNGELHTILTNKKAKGKKRSLVAMIEGVRVSEIAPILEKIPLSARKKVQEVTIDMAHNMSAIVTRVFPDSIQVIDRFHVQKLITEVVQEIRIKCRHLALKEDNKNEKESRRKKEKYVPKVYTNGDTKKQLLARSRYLLFKPKSKWTIKQTARSKILFKEFPEIKKAYNLSMMFRNCYEKGADISDAKKRFDKWYRKVDEEKIDSFITASEAIKLREENILNYFINRSTNASAESFNAKLKGFRTLVRGVVDKDFHLFRIFKIFG